MGLLIYAIYLNYHVFCVLRNLQLCNSLYISFLSRKICNEFFSERSFVISHKTSYIGTLTLDCSTYDISDVLSKVFGFVFVYMLICI